MEESKTGLKFDVWMYPLVPEDLKTKILKSEIPNMRNCNNDVFVRSEFNKKLDEAHKEFRELGYSEKLDYLLFDGYPEELRDKFERSRCPGYMNILGAQVPGTDWSYMVYTRKGSIYDIIQCDNTFGIIMVRSGIYNLLHMGYDSVAGSGDISYVTIPQQDPVFPRKCAPIPFYQNIVSDNKDRFDTLTQNVETEFGYPTHNLHMYLKNLQSVEPDWCFDIEFDMELFDDVFSS
jgi:hypothetical protein